MNYIKPELVQKAKEVDLYTYLQTNNPDELIHVSGNEYKLKSHGSLRISNGKWNWWSHAIGGKSAFDYLMKVENIDFKNAVLMIVGDNKAYESQVKPQEKQSEKATSKELKLPEKNDTVKVIYRYLLNRGIDKQILSKCISDGIIYESKEHHNVIFVGRDEHNIPRYGAWRAANDSRLMGDCFGSDKRFSFQLSGKNEESAHFFESAIDALSYASILKMQGKNWQDVNLISLAGVAATQKESSESKLPLALSEYTKTHPKLKKIYLHLDNDEPGRKATERIKEALSGYEVIDKPSPVGKDINDYLKAKVAEQKRENTR